MIRILHLSDFHFSASVTWDSDPALQALPHAIREASRPLGDPDVVAITGDIARSGRRQDYAVARRWIDGNLLSKAFPHLSQDRILVVPGNHDVDRSVVERRRDVQELQDRLLDMRNQSEIATALSAPASRHALLVRHAAYLEFAAKYGSPLRDRRVPWWLRSLCVRDQHVQFVGMCSTWMSWSDSDRGRLLLGRWQVNTLLTNPPAPSEIRVILVHHPWTFLADFEQDELPSTIRRSAHLVLLGHRHRGQTERSLTPSSDCIELTVGCAYVDSQYENAFQLIEVDGPQKLLRVHHYAWRHDRWGPDRTATRDPPYYIETHRLPTLGGSSASIRPYASICPYTTLVSRLAHTGGRSPALGDGLETHLLTCAECRTTFKAFTLVAQVPGYTVLSLIGGGSSCTVYRAIHDAKQQFEAIKVLDQVSDDRGAYFENEIRDLAALNHPNIVRLYESHTTEATPFYTMEYVDGPPLLQYLRDRKPSFGVRLKIIQDVASAVAYASSRGVPHRDLHPGNILIEASGLPRVIDFGVSRKYMQRETINAGDKSPMVASACSVPAVNAERVCLRALGELLFFALAETPMPAEPGTVLQRILRINQVRRSRDLVSIFHHSVCDATSSAYASCRELTEDLGKYRAGRPVIRGKRSWRRLHVAATALERLIIHHTRMVCTLATFAVALTLSGTYWFTGLRSIVLGHEDYRVALIAVLPSTEAAITNGSVQLDGLDADFSDRASRRLLFAKLLARVGEARPRAVVFDYTFRKCSEEYDREFIAAIKGCQFPVVVGTGTLDANAQPDTCPAIMKAATRWGHVFVTRASALENEVNVPIAVERGFNSPAPALALAGFAAVRFPDSDPQYVIHRDSVEVRYSRRDYSPSQTRWRTSDPADRIPLMSSSVVGKRSDMLDPQDRAAHARFQIETCASWHNRAVPLEDVVGADSGKTLNQLRGHVIIVGQMIPGLDEHTLSSGARVFGCQVQATMLDGLLNGRFVQRMPGFGLLGLVFGWSTLGAIAAWLLTPRTRTSGRAIGAFGWLAIVLGIVAPSHWMRTTVRVALTLGLIMILLDAALLLSQFPRATVAMHTIVAVPTLLAAGCANAVLRALARQLPCLTPTDAWTCSRA